ncbi:hypothetical protein C7S14_0226 [Burkholderia cepacia]|nr:hypothetical protein C7S14_0226 [Burkholderia cepacia]
MTMPPRGSAAGSIVVSGRVIATGGGRNFHVRPPQTKNACRF